MKKQRVLLLGLLVLLLCACGMHVRNENPSSGKAAAADGNAEGSSQAAESPESSDAPESSESSETQNIDSSGAQAAEESTEAVSTFCRIVSGAQGPYPKTLVLANQDISAVYTLSVTEDMADFPLENGMVIEVVHSGAILEVYPELFGEVFEIRPTERPFSNLCSLYLTVLDDLWDDGGVDTLYGVKDLGLDLSQTGLNVSEQWAVSWIFGERHDLPCTSGTFEDFARDGLIDEEHLVWEGGCLFSITEDASETDTLHFKAEKWRGGLCAYFWTDCTAVPSAPGHYTDYEVGGYAIS